MGSQPSKALVTETTVISLVSMDIQHIQSTQTHIQAKHPHTENKIKNPKLLKTIFCKIFMCLKITSIILITYITIITFFKMLQSGLKIGDKTEYSENKIHL